MSGTEHIVYDESVRALDKQESGLDDLRARTGTLLAGAALVTAFLGGQALAHRNDLVRRHLAAGVLDWRAWCAIGAFLGVAVFALAIVLPWRWNFTLSARVLIEDHVQVEERNVPEKLLLFLARRHEDNWDANEKKLIRLFWAFRIATLFLALEVLAWIVVLTS